MCVCRLYVGLYHQGVVRKTTRPDLAEMLTLLARQTVAAEQPVLAAHGLSMWGYIVLAALDRSPIRTQAALAEAIGADKTRIIPTLDELQERGYIERSPDPDDRRARLLAITEPGRSIKDAVQAAIQRGEERWLGQLPANDRDVFLRALRRLAFGAAPSDYAARL
ncbi:MarR family winged helix-turn-helix transcriptional regulator [Candidatus Mycobacterium methanotrophicum]|uniref:MarR family transcriptional regulator n=1 Tax=Candidatus Mycobacterium methanotrophicum TaxID=2943498 RepID=A0ABY4QSP7_9MYCO|nr:MarR family transcriptional regulator [Candidatus Mycobacterium methanotrophicum]UQX12996.1 MarR family transcriptional regulator [Candidatus Mycobacterium methanotrophicum]